MNKFLILIPFLAAAAYASPYPADYSHQTVYVLQRDPVLFAHVGSGIGSTDFIAYKNKGVLAQTNPEFLEVVVIGRCQNQDGSEATKKSIVKLGREYHHTGYMSGPLSFEYGFYPESCQYSSNKPELEMAFSDGKGNWDSLGGANYKVSSNSYYGGHAEIYATHESGPYGSAQVNQKAYDYIVEAMKR